MSKIYVARVRSTYNKRTNKTSYYLLMNGDYWQRIGRDIYNEHMTTSNWREPVKNIPDAGGHSVTETDCFYQIKGRRK